MAPTICDLDRTAPAKERRRAAERRHRRQQEAYFRSPFVIWEEPSNAEGSNSRPNSHFEWEETWRLMGRVEKAREDLQPEDVRRFCFKDCALYVNGPSADQPYLRLLFNQIYQRWYTSRSEDDDISHGAFFCQLMSFQKRRDVSTALTISQVIEFHSELLTTLDSLIPQLQPRPIEYSGKHYVPDDWALLLPPTKYALRATFRHCFIYVNPSELEYKYDWSKQTIIDESVYVVFPRREDAEPYERSTAVQEGVHRLPELEPEQAAVFLCSTIDQAMRFVLALDPQRLRGQQEVHGYYCIVRTGEHVTLEPWSDSIVSSLP